MWKKHNGAACLAEFTQLLAQDLNVLILVILARLPATPRRRTNPAPPPLPLLNLRTPSNRLRLTPSRTSSVSLGGRDRRLTRRTTMRTKRLLLLRQRGGFDGRPNRREDGLALSAGEKSDTGDNLALGWRRELGVVGKKGGTVSLPG